MKVVATVKCPVPKAKIVRHVRIAAMLVALGCHGADAAEPLVTHVVANGWQSTDFRDPPNPGCSISGGGSMPGSWLLMGASRAHPDPVTLVIRKAGWAIPSGTAIRILARFTDGVSIQIPGTGGGQSITADLSGEPLRRWVHELTSSTGMQLAFGGNEPDWSFDLAGTTIVVNAMDDCFRSHQITGVGAPFGKVAVPHSGISVSQATQPFGGPVRPETQAPTMPMQLATEAAPSPVPPPTYVPQSSAYPPQGPAPVAPSSGETSISSWFGSTNMQTRPFHVEGPWELQWTTAGGFFALTLHDAASGKDRLVANGDTAGSSTSYQPHGGDYYLEVEGRTPWTARAVSLASNVAPAIPRTPPLTATAESHRAAGYPAARGQEAFVAVVEAARRVYADAANDMAKGAARPARARALCQALPSGRAADWSGRVTELSTNGEGKGVIVIEVGPAVFFRTWNNALSDAVDGTMIEPGTALFQSTASLTVGQAVRFSATLVQGATDCFQEASLTMRGSITAPEFVMHLTSIAAVE